jgi:hypothetical protein
MLLQTPGRRSLDSRFQALAASLRIVSFFQVDLDGAGFHLHASFCILPRRNHQRTLELCNSFPEAYEKAKQLNRELIGLLCQLRIGNITYDLQRWTIVDAKWVERKLRLVKLKEKSKNAIIVSKAACEQINFTHIYNCSANQACKENFQIKNTTS